MSRLRQLDDGLRTRADAEPDAEWGIRSLALRLPRGHRIDGHSHDWGQLMLATRGVMDLQTANEAWVVPPGRSVWIPPAVVHSIQIAGDVALSTLYFRPDLADRLFSGCRVLQPPPLLRELILHVVRLGRLDLSVAAQKRLAGVLVDQILATPAMPLDLPLPADPRAQRVSSMLRASPGADLTLPALSRQSGASPRTLERLFQRETGMSLGQWRRQARLLHALHRLAQGASVTDVALDVGYTGASSFIAVFKKAFGETPGQYRKREPEGTDAR